MYITSLSLCIVPHTIGAPLLVASPPACFLMKSDPRVKEIVDTLLRAEGVKWRAYLRDCPRGGTHIVQCSYGATQWEHVGNLYEVCLAEGGSRCARHTKPLDRQMANATRLTMLSQLSALRPWPYNKEVYWAQTVALRGPLENEIMQDAARDAAFRSRSYSLPSGASSLDVAQLRFNGTGARSHASNTAPSSRRSSLAMSADGSAPTASSGTRAERSLVGSRTTASSQGSIRSERGPVGRPANPTCEVIVYIYVPGKHAPLVVHATGTPRDNVVEFVFGQRKIHDALGVDAATRPKPTYLIYNRTIEGWAMYPKAHQSLFIAPDERLLYREEYVFATPNLDYYLALLLSADRGRPLLPQPSPWTYASHRASAPGTPSPPSASSSLGQSPPRMLSSPEMAEMDLKHPAPATDVKRNKRVRSASPGPRSTRRKLIPPPNNVGMIDLTGDSDEDSDDGDIVFITTTQAAGNPAHRALLPHDAKGRDKGKAKAVR
ncbi:hypothetical protein OH77DRAFT_1585696 [Trametes cingulata]|nr:hypothetical protein OH77DRAFT_1585696 [Trametes cingulata]